MQCPFFSFLGLQILNFVAILIFSFSILLYSLQKFYAGSTPLTLQHDYRYNFRFIFLLSPWRMRNAGLGPSVTLNYSNDYPVLVGGRGLFVYFALFLSIWLICMWRDYIARRSAFLHRLPCPPQWHKDWWWILSSQRDFACSQNFSLGTC